jgi:hypothetical protein
MEGLVENAETGEMQAPPAIDPAERTRRQKESFKNAWKEYNVKFPPYR